MYNARVKNYQREALKTRVAGADRYEIIQMLMAGAVEKMVLAKVSIEKRHLEAKAEHISKASAIIEALRGSLDFEVGGEVTENLYALYSYMLDRLLDASMQNDPAIVDEVSNLLKEIKSAWDAIPIDVRKQTLDANGADANVG
ncbi:MULTISPECIES: flagellar export chaperone FliS [Pseudoalteromonas]|uniref:Flagellar secretion chaperone FliS n=1 Tax=Pseudoalteromonas piscicida TaxID=43662 RepID=A0AAQ2IQQ8_PSEO7|nr:MULTISPECIES: flagellar export chaperone FliS [Pseudoalteromonas]ATD05799.1 flagellar protein FliS [Pseudoalteromonas piscicida]AUJ69467.1 Flagellar protein FliS [Pseudoalteromonas sp. NC201]KJY92908.1 flagellar protein FliS [Pseudoalteromonas piscicida]MCF2827740.1 flagellar export chaperone FliS [Pseudoalteromonas sp. OF5H-5]MCF2830262.1 flagellar export chaperone FliS [Pseudoalteromonas sp. DL2-H6]|tara:strand:+ start:187 stop:615 length:429 start_codon:yes stop_codon:yes gene_type:complete